MNNIDKGVIQVLDQLKNSGQLNSYLIDDDERKWTKLVYDIMINKFDMPFGNSTMQQASDIFNNAVRVWKGKNKLGNMMNMESRTMNMNIINEIGDTVRGQEMLGRTAERAHQRAQRTSGADKQRHEKTEWDAYQTAAGNSRKHLDGSGAHFARGRDAEYDEHWDDGRYPWSKKHKSKNESKTMNKKLIRLTESDIHKIVKESVNKILKEVKYGGESLHGNNSKDWYVLSQIRGYRDNDKYGHKKYQTKAEYDDEYGKGLRDYNNGLSLDDMEYDCCEDGFIPYIDNDKVREKTSRIRSKMPKI